MIDKRDFISKIVNCKAYISECLRHNKQCGFCLMSFECKTFYKATTSFTNTMNENEGETK